jgi:hypothetical protein
MDLAIWLAVGGLALLCLVTLAAVVVLRRSWARAGARERAASDDRFAELDAQLAALRPAQAEPPTVGTERPSEFVITELGIAPQLREAPTTAPDGPAFVDIVLRESVVKAASLAHGVRRGLTPASRNRIRFEMKQEVRRSRRQRRSDLKQARRDLHQRQRAALVEEAEAG